MKIQDVCEVVRGSSPRPQGDSRYYGGPVPRLMVADVTRDGMYVTPHIDSLTEEGAARSRPMKAGDLVIAVSGAPGLPAILKTDACIHDGFVGLRNLDQETVNPEFLYRYLYYVKTQSGHGAVGAIFKNLTSDQIRDLEIPLPPLPEQKRIADILDKADAIRRKRRLALNEIETLSLSSYRHQFGHPIAASDSLPLGECVTMLSGGTPSKSNDAYWNGDFPWVSPKDMKVDYISSAEDHVTDLAFQETNLKKLPAEAILIVVRGMILAHTIPVALTDVPVAINQDMKALIANDGYDPHFLCWSLKAAHNYILGKVATAAHGTKRLEVEHLASFPIPRVKLSEQRHFARIVQKIRDSRDRLATGVPEDLFNSLVQRAFKGQL